MVTSKQEQAVQKTWRGPERSKTLIRLGTLEGEHRVLCRRNLVLVLLREQMSGIRLGCLRFPAQEQKFPPLFMQIIALNS